MLTYSCLCPQMEQLELKLASELPSTAKVVACRFPFPTWVPERTAGEGIDTVWVYDAKTFKSHGITMKRTPEHMDTPESQTGVHTFSSLWIVLFAFLGQTFIYASPTWTVEWPKWKWKEKMWRFHALLQETDFNEKELRKKNPAWNRNWFLWMFASIFVIVVSFSKGEKCAFCI